MKCYYCQKECNSCDIPPKTYGWWVCRNHPHFSFRWTNEDGTIDTRYIRVFHNGKEYEIHFDLKNNTTRIAQLFYDEEMAMGWIDFLTGLTFSGILESITPENAKQKLELMLVFS